MEIFMIAGAVGILLSIVLMASLWYVVSLLFAESESGQHAAPWFLKIFAVVVMLFTLFSNRNQQQRYPEL